MSNAIDLNEVFRAVVAKYDEISAILVANNFGMNMVRARQKPEDKKSIPNQEAFKTLTSELSGDEGHCLANPYIFVKAIYERKDTNQICCDFSLLASQFNSRGGLAKSSEDFRQLSEYLSWHARLKLLEMLGIELTVKPNLEPLERHLGLRS